MAPNGHLAGVIAVLTSVLGSMHVRLGADRSATEAGYAPRASVRPPTRIARSLSPAEGGRPGGLAGLDAESRILRHFVISLGHLEVKHRHQG